MTSREFYNYLDNTFSPQCERLGLRRGKGATALCMLDLPTGTMIYEILKGVKNPYDPLLGGRLDVRCDLVDGPEPKARGFSSGISYLRYYDDADLQAMCKARDGVLNKILAQKCAGDFDQLMFKTFSPILRLELGNEIRRNQPPSLRYFDRRDVEAWGEFFGSRLGKTIEGIKSDRELPVDRRSK